MACNGSGFGTYRMRVPGSLSEGRCPVGEGQGAWQAYFGAPAGPLGRLEALAYDESGCPGSYLLYSEPVRVYFREGLPLRWKVIFGEDGGDRTNGKT